MFKKCKKKSKFSNLLVDPTLISQMICINVTSLDILLNQLSNIVREPNPEFLQKSILPYTVSPLDFLDFFHLSVS